MSIASTTAPNGSPIVKKCRDPQPSTSTRMVSMNGPKVSLPRPLDQEFDRIRPGKRYAVRSSKY